MSTPTNVITDDAAAALPSASRGAGGIPASKSDKQRKPLIGAQVIVWLSVRLGFYLSLYVASIGPMFWYWYEANHLGGMEPIYAFYYPLLMLCEIEWIRDLVNAYIRFWIL